MGEVPLFGIWKLAGLLERGCGWDGFGDGVKYVLYSVYRGGEEVQMVKLWLEVDGV